MTKQPQLGADEFLPLEAALVWVANRDPTATANVLFRWNSVIVSTGKRVRPHLGPQMQAAWSELRASITKGEIAARGSPDAPIGLPTHKPWLDQTGLIELQQVSTLQLADGERLALVHVAMPLVAAPRWLDVIIDKQNLLRVFPVDIDGLAKMPTRPGRDYKSQAIREAFQALAAGGALPDWSEDDAFHHVNTWLIKHGRKKVELSTFKKEWQKLPRS